MLTKWLTVVHNNQRSVINIYAAVLCLLNENICLNITWVINPYILDTWVRSWILKYPVRYITLGTKHLNNNIIFFLNTICCVNFSTSNKKKQKQGVKNEKLGVCEKRWFGPINVTHCYRNFVDDTGRYHLPTCFSSSLVMFCLISTQRRNRKKKWGQNRDDRFQQQEMPSGAPGPWETRKWAVNRDNVINDRRNYIKWN